MATIPTIIVQKIASGAAVTGVLPDIGGNAPNLDTEVFKQLRGRIWRYDELDAGGIFESPVELVRRLVNQSQVPQKGLDHHQHHEVFDRVGFKLLRVNFQGTGTTRVQGFLRDPYANAAVVTGEALTVAPAFDGSNKRNITATLANAPVVPETVVITTAGGEVFRDFGDGKLKSDGGGEKDTKKLPQPSGTIDYATGKVRLQYANAPDTGTAVTADYRHIDSVPPVDHEFLDTDDITGIDTTSFSVDLAAGSPGTLMVPPGWQLRFVSTGSLSAAGSLGIMVGQGMDYTIGQEVHTFGAPA